MEKVKDSVGLLTARAIRLTLWAFPVGLMSVALVSSSAPAAAKQSEPQPSCASAAALATAGEKDEARKVYVKVLLAEPTSGCAASGLAELNPKNAEAAAAECAKGEAFEALNRYNDAEAAFKAGLEKNPKSDCAQEGLDRVGPSSATTFLKELVGDLPYILLAIGLVLLAGLLVACLGHFRGIGRILRRIPPYRALLAPRLSIAALEDEAVAGKPGAPFVARIKERMRRMRDEAIGYDDPFDIDFNTPGEEFADIVSSSGGGLKSSLAAVSDVSDQTKIVAALLNMVYAALPIPRLSVSGCVEPPSKAGPGATMVLEDGSRLEAALTLRGAPLEEGANPTAPDYLPLADSAAVWAQYEVARLLDYGDVRLDSAESWALVREGLQHYRAGDLEKARLAYAKAIQLNPGTWAAYLGAALAEARIDGSFERSIEILEEALAEMRGV